MKPSRCFAIAFGIFGTLSTAIQPALAASDTWNGGANPNFNWSGSANWTGGNAPPLAGDALLFDLTTGLSNTNDLAAGTSFSGITFNSTAGAFNLYGNPIVLGGNVVNNSANTETINLGMSLGAARTFNGASGPLVINGPITNTTTKGFAVTLSGNGTLADLLYPNSTPVGVSLIVSGNWTMLDGTGNGSQVVAVTNSASNGSPIGIPGGGEFNYGSVSSAPNLLIGTNASVSVGTGSSGTGTMNMTNGVLTLGGLNVANNSSGSPVGILNMVGGTLNIGLGAGFALTIGNNPVGGTATMTVSGGTVNVMNAAGSTAAGSINIATRGTCALNISGSGLVECATLTVNNFQSAGQHGTVNLNGGTLLVSSITTRSGTDTGGGAMISYNGGTVQAGASSTTFITQSGVGNMLTNQILSGGAIFNTAGFNDTVTLPLLTGASPDGGLTKNGAGTLTLSAANTYTGNTIINGGTLALSGSGSIANSPAISVGSGATLDASTRSDGTLTLAGGQTLTGSGTVTGTAVASADAVIAPGTVGIGTLSFGGALTLNSLSTNNFVVTAAGGASNQVAVVGLLTPNSSVIKVASGSPLPPSTNTLFTYGTVSGTFSPTVVFDVTPVHPASIVDDGAGHIELVIANSGPAIANIVTNNVTSGSLWKIAISDLKTAAGWSDADGDTVNLSTVAATSANGTNVTHDTTYIYYQGLVTQEDHFTYTVVDPYGAMATGTVYLEAMPATAPSISNPAVDGNGHPTFSGHAIPGYTYGVESSTTSPTGPWAEAGTVTPAADGSWAFTDTDQTNPGTIFYRLYYPDNPSSPPQ